MIQTSKGLKYSISHSGTSESCPERLKHFQSPVPPLPIHHLSPLVHAMNKSCQSIPGRTARTSSRLLSNVFTPNTGLVIQSSEEDLACSGKV